ncbi:ArsR/SmtB family transcription factor [Acidaminococcus sp.]|uniref:ArsR/SmtB family transcription factor n=1 Tax=Acidaminococcus sp. TaxID=1872103 RepID=UPI003AB1CD96
MNQLELFKALSNPIRLQILTWLKDPAANFPPQGLHIPEGDSFDHSVCVGSIQEKLGISQSTVSHYLDLMQRSGLLESARFGKWTYYRRNEANIQALAEFIKNEL